MKILDVLARYSAKEKALEKEIEKQKDIFWNKFLSHRAVLMDYGYIKDDYRQKKGLQYPKSVLRMNYSLHR